MLQRAEFPDTAGEATVLCISPDGRRLYAAVGRTRQIYAFEIDEQTGCLLYLGSVPDGDFTRGMACLPDGSFMFSASSESGTVTAFPLRENSIPGSPAAKLELLHAASIAVLES